MVNFFKDLIIEIFKYFNYRPIKLPLYEEMMRVEHVKTMVSKMRSPDLPPELLKNCKVSPNRIQVLSAFPKTIAKRFPEQIKQHYLFKAIVATSMSNCFITEMGITFLQQISR